MMSQSVASNTDKISGTSEQTLLPDERAWSQVRVRMWIAGAFLLLFLATFLIIAPKIQQRLDSQTRNRLEQAGISAATLEFDWDYRNLTVRGYLPENVSTGELASILRGTREQSSAFFANGIRHLRFNLDEGVPARGVVAVEDLQVQVSADKSVATLQGVVQTDAQRKALVKAMLASGVENVFDNLDTQSITETPVVNRRVAALSGLLRELGPEKIQRAEISMTEEELHYRVTAQDKDSVVAIERAAGVEIADFAITGGVDLLLHKRLNLSAESDGETIVIDGVVYSDAHRRRLLFAASEAVGSDNVVDQLRAAERTSEAPELMAQVDSVAAIVSRFAPGITGAVTLNNGELQVNAQAGSEEVRDYLLSPTASARSIGLTIVDNVRVVGPQDDTVALQVSLDKFIAQVRRTVVFASGESVLSDAAMQTLDKVAAEISGYPGLVVEIEGHTDNVGRAATNEQLSQSRANAVRDYLAGRVANGSRLIAVGYGHRKPIASNDTADGRQANRRVHFSVLKQPQDPES